MRRSAEAHFRDSMATLADHATVVPCYANQKSDPCKSPCWRTCATAIAARPSRSVWEDKGRVAAPEAHKRFAKLHFRLDSRCLRPPPHRSFQQGTCCASYAACKKETTTHTLGAMYRGNLGMFAKQLPAREGPLRAGVIPRFCIAKQAVSGCWWAPPQGMPPPQCARARPEASRPPRPTARNMRATPSPLALPILRPTCESIAEGQLFSRGVGSAENRLHKPFAFVGALGAKRCSHPLRPSRNNACCRL